MHIAYFHFGFYCCCCCCCCHCCCSVLFTRCRFPFIVLSIWHIKAFWCKYFMNKHFAHSRSPCRQRVPSIHCHGFGYTRSSVFYSRFGLCVSFWWFFSPFSFHPFGHDSRHIHVWPTYSFSVYKNNHNRLLFTLLSTAITCKIHARSVHKFCGRTGFRKPLTDKKRRRQNILHCKQGRTQKGMSIGLDRKHTIDHVINGHDYKRTNKFIVE